MIMCVPDYIMSRFDAATEQFLYLYIFKKYFQGDPEPFIRNVFTLDTCGQIVGSEVISCKTEQELLERWAEFVRESDPDLTSGAVTKSAGVVGLTLGYNAQNLGRLVVGTEFDFNWRNLDFTIPAGTCGLGCEFKSNWFSTARLRFGYQIDRFLPYVTAGLSISDFSASIAGQPVKNSLSFNFTAGAGVEFVIYDALRGKVEYLFVNHDNISCVVECNGPVNMRASENVFRVGLNYRLWER